MGNMGGYGRQRRITRQSGWGAWWSALSGKGWTLNSPSPIISRISHAKPHQKSQPKRKKLLSYFTRLENDNAAEKGTREKNSAAMPQRNFSSLPLLFVAGKKDDTMPTVS